MTLSTAMDSMPFSAVPPFDPGSARRDSRLSGAPVGNPVEPGSGLSSLEEARLIRRAQSGDDRAREELTHLNMRLIYSVARRYRCRSLTLEDLVQEGVVGFLAAVDRFDPAFGCRLSTYATHWIRQAISRAIDQHDRLIRLPLQASTELRQLEQARSSLRQQLQREPDPDELAQECCLTVDRVAQLLGASEPVSLETLIGPDQELPLGEVAVDKAATDPEAGTLADAGAAELRRMLKTLVPRERQVLELRYGLTGQGACSLQEMSARMGLSREGVRQIEVRALARLRRALRAAHWE